MRKLLAVLLVLGLLVTLVGSSSIVLAQEPTVEPTEEATVEPTEEPTVAPTEEATVAPTEEATVAPTEEATVAPTEEATVAPTEEATVEPTEEATVEPTEEPTVAPTEEATVAPTEEPTVAPTEEVDLVVESADISASAFPNTGIANSEFYVQNKNTTLTDPDIQAVAEYYGGATCTGGGACTATKSVPPLASKQFSSTDNPAGDGFSGAAVVSSDGDAAVVTNLFWNNQKRAASYVGVSQGATEIFFPFVSAAYRLSGQSSSISIQNAGTGSATINVTYYNRDGTQCGTTHVESNVAAGTQVTYDLADFASSSAIPNFDTQCSGNGEWRGAVGVSSAEPLAGVAVVHWPTYSGAYNAFSTADAQTYANFPSAYRRLVSGQWYQNSNITVQNLCPVGTDANVTVTFYNDSGTQVSQFSDTIPGLSSHAYNTRAGGSVPASTFNGLGTFHIGPVSVTSGAPNNCPIVGVSLTQWQIDDFAGIYNSETDGLTELFIPEVQRIETGGFPRNTAMVIQNLSSSQATVDLVFYDQTGTQLLAINNHTIAGNAAIPLNTRAGGDVPASTFYALGSNFTGSAYISSNQPILGIVNSRWNLSTDNKATQWNMLK